MKNIKKSQLFIQDSKKSSLGALSEKYDKSNITKKNEEKTKIFNLERIILTQKFLVLFLLIFGFLVCSVAYYFTNNNNNNYYKSDYKSEIGNVVKSEVEFDNNSNKIDTTDATTIPTTSTSTTLEKNLVNSKFSADNNANSTIINPSCGDEYELPCKTENGSFCNKGTIVGADGLCHKLECAPTIPSGKEGCGGWALNWCKNNKNNNKTSA